jgi:predicted DsbA family dithiol-disulfide isomerase
MRARTSEATTGEITMTNTIVCPFCHKQNCKLELARRARPLALESASTVDDLSPEQVRLAGQLEALYMSDAGLPTTLYAPRYGRSPGT